jgi:hypothetical protein
LFNFKAANDQYFKLRAYGILLFQVKPGHKYKIR